MSEENQGEGGDDKVNGDLLDYYLAANAGEENDPEAIYSLVGPTVDSDWIVRWYIDFCDLVGIDPDFNHFDHDADTLRFVEFIGGGEGSDTLNGVEMTGDDQLVFTIFGYEGDDVITGGDHYDNLNGGDGSDTIYGGLGDDLINGGNDEDFLYGQCGDDTIFGGKKTDEIYGGCGDDELHGENGGDLIFGESGTDILIGGRGDDTLNGGAGDDTLDGGVADDELTGGAGMDTFVFSYRGDENNIDHITDYEDGELIDFRPAGVSASDIQVFEDAQYYGSQQVHQTRLFYEGDNGEMHELRIWSVDYIEYAAMNIEFA